MRPDSEEAKVTMAIMYLTGDAKLWWRTKYAEMQGWPRSTVTCLATLISSGLVAGTLPSVELCFASLERGRLSSH